MDPPWPAYRRASTAAESAQPWLRRPRRGSINDAAGRGPLPKGTPIKVEPHTKAPIVPRSSATTTTTTTTTVDAMPPLEDMDDDTDTTTTDTTTTTTTTAQEEPEPIDRADAARSYRPDAAWGEWSPARLFDHRGCKDARAYARAHRMALFAVEISDQSRAMNYVVGPWECVEDMILRDQLQGAREPLLVTNSEAKHAVYEAVFRDQQVMPFFDLEFMADQAHGNQRLYDMTEHMDQMTRTVARMASALMAELFPDQVVLPETARRPLAPSADSAYRMWTARLLHRRHYEAPRGPVVSPVVLNPETDWRVLDASRDAKRSQHLVLDNTACALCWDTLVDQAIFMGLLLRRIYRAAFALDIARAGSAADRRPCARSSSGEGDGTATPSDPVLADAWFRDNEFRSAARSLFVQDRFSVSGTPGMTKTQDAEPASATTSIRHAAAAPPKGSRRVWTTVVDSSVTKPFQLFRTAFSSKRGQDRPLLPRAEVFGLGPSGLPSHQRCAVTRGQQLRATLIGRVPRGRLVQRLSFARSYPGMFPGGGAAAGPELEDGPATSSLSLSAWRWVPNYQGRGADALPRIDRRRSVAALSSAGVGSGGSRATADEPYPWQFAQDAEVVAVWLSRVDPADPVAADSIASMLDFTMPTAATGLTLPVRKRPRPLGDPREHIESLEYAGAGPATSAADAIVRFVAASADLRPWIEHAGGRDDLAASLRIKVSRTRLPGRPPARPGAPPDPPRIIDTALVDARQHYCPLQRATHDSGRPFLLIDGRTGRVRVRCNAAKCDREALALPIAMLPEDLRVVFAARSTSAPPPAKRHKKD